MMATAAVRVVAIIADILDGYIDNEPEDFWSKAPAGAATGVPAFCSVLETVAGTGGEGGTVLQDDITLGYNLA
jgi:hypothetical protein